MIYVRKSEKVEAELWRGDNLDNVLRLSPHIRYKDETESIEIRGEIVPIGSYVVAQGGTVVAYPGNEFRQKFRMTGVAYR